MKLCFMKLRFCLLSTYGRRAFAALVRRCLTLCQMIYEILQSAHRPSDSRWRLVFSLPISTFSALGVSHIMRSINVRYLLTYFNENVAKKVDNARACGSHRRSASNLARTVLDFPHNRREFASADGVPAELRCGVVRCVALRYGILNNANHTSVVNPIVYAYFPPGPQSISQRQRLWTITNYYA